MTYTDREKLETVEYLIELWRPGRSSSIESERATYLILKSIADEIRARDPLLSDDTLNKLERAIGNARKNRVQQTYSSGNLREIAELVIGKWAVIREALASKAKEAQS